MNELHPIPFRIDYVNPKGVIVHTETVMVIGYDDACDHGWGHLPNGANDFQVIEVGGDTL